MAHTLPAEVGALKFRWREATAQIDAQRGELARHRDAYPLAAASRDAESALRRAAADVVALKAVVEGSAASLGVEAAARLGDAMAALADRCVDAAEQAQVGHSRMRETIERLDRVCVLHELRAGIASSREAVVEGAFARLAAAHDVAVQHMSWALLYLRSVMAERVQWQLDHGTNPASLPASTSFVRRCLEGLRFLQRGLEDGPQPGPIFAVDTPVQAAGRFATAVDARNAPAGNRYVTPREELAIVQQLLLPNEGGGGDASVIIADIDALRADAAERRRGLSGALNGVRVQLMRLREGLDGLRGVVQEEVVRLRQFPLRDAISEIIGVVRADADTQAAQERRELVGATQLLMEKNRRAFVHAEMTPRGTRRASSISSVGSAAAGPLRLNTSRPTSALVATPPAPTAVILAMPTLARSSSRGSSAGAVRTPVPPPPDAEGAAVQALKDADMDSRPVHHSGTASQQVAEERHGGELQRGQASEAGGDDGLTGFAPRAQSALREAHTPGDEPSVPSTRAAVGASDIAASKSASMVTVPPSLPRRQQRATMRPSHPPPPAATADPQVRARSVAAAVTDFFTRHEALLSPSRAARAAAAPYRLQHTAQERLHAKVRRALEMTEALAKQSENLLQCRSGSGMSAVVRGEPMQYTECETLRVDGAPSPREPPRPSRSPRAVPRHPAPLLYTEWLTERTAGLL